MRANQKGYTVIEILIAIAISATLIGALVPSIFLITGETRMVTHQTAGTLQVQNAARWISRDVKMAADTNLEDGAPAVDNLTLLWTDKHQDINQEHTVQCYLSDGQLKRNFDGVVTTVARYISNVEFSRNSSVITVVITTAADGMTGDSEKGVYHVTLRQ